MKIVKRILEKIGVIKLLNKVINAFSFEAGGLDITDDVAVLYRKNIVIKNIIFVSNWAYTAILFVISIGESNASNWILTIAFMPLTFIINQTLKRFIFDEPDSMLKQQIAMYMTSFYMFLSAVLIYFKLKSSPDLNSLSEGGYMLLYYSLLVVALYGDPKMMKVIMPWMLVIVTIIHLTLTYQLFNKSVGYNRDEFLKGFFKTNEFRDIGLRTLIMLLFMLVLYSTVKISAYMQRQRKNELSRRIDVEDDFRNVVGELFDIMLDSNLLDSRKKEETELIAIMSKKMASIMGLPPVRCNEIYDYANIKIDQSASFSNLSNKKNLNANEFKILKEKSDYASILVKRIQLAQKCVDIIRTHIENNADFQFVEKEKQIQSSVEGQVILISDLYVTLRSATSYKRPYTHRSALELLDETFSVYFDDEVVERFFKWNRDFEEMFDKF